MQIRRSNTSSTPGTTLFGGELAYSYAGNNLFIGAQTGVGTAATKIGGAKFAYVDQSTPGTLTANAAKITDANAFISNTYTVGLFVAPSIASPVANATAALITSISPNGTSSQLGASAGGSNTELVTSWAIKTYVDGKVAGAGGFSNGTAYTWSAVQTFNANVVIAGNTTAQLIVGTAADGVDANSTVISVGNATVFTTINATSFSGTANNANTLGGNLPAYYTNATNITTGTLPHAQLPANVVIWSNTNTFTANQTFNLAVITNGNATSYFVAGTTGANTTVNATAIFNYANATTYNGSNTTTTFAVDTTTSTQALMNTTALALSTGTVRVGNAAAANAFVNTTAYVVQNATSVSTLTAANITSPAAVIGGQITANATIVNFGTVANLIATSAQLNVRDIIASGNLTIQGTTTTIDTTTLSVKDNFVVLASNTATGTTFTDNIDTGWHTATGNTGTTFYSGLARIAASSSNSNPYFKLFQTGTNPNTTIIDTSANTGTLQAFLRPYGASGAASNGFVANATNLLITANGTFTANIIANTLSLSTALPAGSGGTGQGSYTAGDILYASGTSALSKLGIGTPGYVLQANSSNLPEFNTLDGGTF